MGVLKTLFPISTEEMQLLKINKISSKKIEKKYSDVRFNFDKFIHDYYLMFHYCQMSSVVERVLESGVYIEDKQNHFLELRYISPTKANQIYTWLKRATLANFKKYAVGYERTDNYGTKITQENYQQYYEQYVSPFIGFVLKNSTNQNGLLLVSM